ncbi:cytochrome c peroxidase [Bradyrhizobium sp. STM 3557]|uniref:cytochrome c peroxidase n=1 Tax=Bradyrhizobium sp. STM 3557 TaxID=578920 RepID=UPI00388D643F
MIRRALLAVAIGLFGLSLFEGAGAFPLSGDQTVLPPGTELNEDAIYRPTEVFHSEARGGFKSYQVDLGDLAFNSPNLLGGPARQAGMSCGTCHVNGAGNARLYIPGMSTRPGNFDTTGPLFNPKAHNGVLDPVRIPSLRGARFLAPYGHDGRIASLRDFVRNVVVNEFAGDEPSPAILDALVAYIEDIDFLQNTSLDSRGRLTTQASEAERRGEAIFARPFPHDASMSCATCHIPSEGFVDHRQHNVGSGGLFKTPTLLNADFNAPYFHDGRFDRLDQVVDHFDRTYELALTPQDRADLTAYLVAVGDGLLPLDREGVTARIKEINDFATVLEIAIPAHDLAVIDLAVDTIGRELRELTEQFPDRRDPTVTDGLRERLAARAILKDTVILFRRIGAAAAAGRFDEAAAQFSIYRKLSFVALPQILANAQQWSLFNPRIHRAHYAALWQNLRQAGKPAQALAAPALPIVEAKPTPAEH